MLGITVLLIGGLICVVLGYFILKIICACRKKNVDPKKNENTSARRKRPRKKKKPTSSKSKKKKKLTTHRPKKKQSKRTTSKKSKSTKRSKASNSLQATNQIKNSSLLPVKSESHDMKTEHVEKPVNQVSFYQIDENHMDKSFLPIARWRAQSKRNETKKPECLWINNDDPYSTLFEVMNCVDTVKNVMPCTEDDTTDFSKYEYEFNYDEEHLFRC
ncbi:unnamed protein product [Rotaria socialis]|uniref:Uncharacterized protein n=1 Tax=Rotaria socialis TaxID=392032 RepID=A0A821FSZ9_9BILA|nr:unnamed protein product [Rotaria socialis]CAF4655579.1 unnamed protein product [Rotaria socialis]